MKLFVAGVSHKTAPVEIREQLAVPRNELVDLARYLKLFGHFDELVLLSTCNRVEIYGTTRQSIDSIKSALQLLSSEPVDLDPYVYVHQDAEAGHHLFRVAAGLDSMADRDGDRARARPDPRRRADDRARRRNRNHRPDQECL